MKVHLIALGGSAMHNLAIALHKKGIVVTGSDDEIVDPAKSNLQRYGLLPPTYGWDVSRITNELNAVILGMHARLDNPELIRAQELGIRIYSYPEYLYEQTKNKTRVVIAGSHGKTTITAMILHVLKYHNRNFDYLAGAALEGFETSLKLSDEAPVAIFEGDEYLASALDRRPKFLLYKPDIALISGVAWDHINVFPTYRSYVEQFENFVKELPSNGSLIYCDEDEEVQKLSSLASNRVKKYPYKTLDNFVKDGVTYLPQTPVRTVTGGPEGALRLEVFGKHNLLNMGGARQVCLLLGISEKEFDEAISTFRGAARRLQLVVRNEITNVYWDFAHSPSKLTATIQAVKEQFPSRKLVACMELHTFSSLTKEFLKEYKGAMDKADIRKVYFNPHVLEHKRLPAISAEEVKGFFGEVEVYTDSAKMIDSLKQMEWYNTNLLMMSSGNFDGVNVKVLAEDLIQRK